MGLRLGRFFALWLVLQILTSVKSTENNLPATLIETVAPQSVRRGEQVSLQKAFVIDHSRAAVNCTVHYVYKKGLSCGQVTPSVFDCGYGGPLTFQHYGCLVDHELVNFQLSFRFEDHISSFNGTGMKSDTNSPVSIEMFMLELIVTDTSPSLSKIELIRTVNPDPYGIPEGVKGGNDTETSNLGLRLVFPTGLTGKCHYEVLNKFPKLSLPQFGDLSGQTDHLLPCGYVHSPLSYFPRINVNVRDFVLLRLYRRNENEMVTESFVVVPIVTAINGSTRGTGGQRKSAFETVETPTKDFSVQQIIFAPVNPNLFNLSSTVFSNTLGYPPMKFIIDVHQHVGTFQTVQSSTENIWHTEFTGKDLLERRVVFYPKDNAVTNTPVLFYYSTYFDAAGMLVTRGQISVTIQKHIIRDWPAQRTNKPFALLEGGTAIIDHKSFDMYLIGKCVLQASMRLVIPPRYGYLVYLNGTTIEEKKPKFLVGAVINGTVIQYKHSQKESFYDKMVWEVSCLDGPLLNISLTALIALIDDTPPTAAKRTYDVTLYQKEHFSLSDSMFQIKDMDSPVEETLFTVSGNLTGVLVKSENPLKNDRLFPFVQVSSDSIETITQFYLLELRLRLVWYIPPTGGDNNTDIIEFTLVDSNGNRADKLYSLRISKSPLKLQETLFISTDESYPSVQRQQSTMTIFDIYSVYITPLYIYTHVPSVTAADVMYTVTSPIESGHLCILSVKDCNSSISEFTQQDINRQRIFYSPFQEFKEETIVLIPTLYKIPSYIPRKLSLTIELAHNQIPVAKKEKMFWVNYGTERRIPARFFRKHPRAAKFKVTKRTEYGHMSYRNGSSYDLEYFDLDDLIKAKVWYTYDRTLPYVCSDYFNFDVVLSNTMYSSSFQILIRQSSKSKLNVNITSRQLLGQNRFVIGSNDFDITSSFCPEFVNFYLIEPPKFGVLSLTDVKNNLVIELNAFSTFTAKDINSGLLHYSLRHTGPITSNMTDNIFLNASDPVSQWPNQHRRYYTSPGLYILRIERYPNISHILQIHISSSVAVTWLEDLGRYGYLLKQSDIRIFNSTIPPSKVFIAAENYEPYGTLKLNSSTFNIEQVNSGKVRYDLNTISPEGPYKTTFNFTIYIISKSNFSLLRKLPEKHYFTFSWAVIEFDKRRIVVSEEDRRVIITIR